jgi:hypothetical protein
MQELKIKVNQKVNGKYSEVGEVAIFVPMLHEVFPDAVKIAKDKDGKDVTEEGLPVYEKDEHNWIQGSMLAQVKAQARNKLQPKTAQLKAGQTIATDWASLTAEGERVGNPEALAAIREAKGDFAAWVATLGKSAGAQATLNTLFGNKQALSLQSSDNKAKMAQYVTDFAKSLDEAKQERYTRYLESVIAACEVVTEVDDF